MEERILHLLEGLKSEMGSLNAKVDNIESEMGSLKSDVVSVKSDMGSMKSEMGSLKSELNSLKSDMHNRFDRVDHLLEGIGGQFEHQTSQRITEGQAISKELVNIKSRIFDLETKTM